VSSFVLSAEDGASRIAKKVHADARRAGHSLNQKTQRYDARTDAGIGEWAICTFDFASLFVQVHISSFSTPRIDDFIRPHTLDLDNHIFESC
jgi:hypothetical protein